MMADKPVLEDLIPDIEKLLSDVAAGTTQPVSQEMLAEFGANIAQKMERALKGRSPVRRREILRASSVGKPCTRQLWYEYNRPEVGEPLAPNTLIKFLYGDIIEEVVLLLAKLAGHEVESEQESVEMALVNGWKLQGSMDCVIDGSVVDIKSASSFAFKKFKEGTIAQDDPFGYLTQVTTYDMLKLNPPSSDRLFPALLALDKQNGSLALHKLSTKEYRDAQKAFNLRTSTLPKALESDPPPDRAFSDEPFQKGGNQKLCTNCSYCSYKNTCWSDANDGRGLRVFNYSGRPVFLTKVVKEPGVQEITNG